ncbi:glycoside hydrolase family 32 protein [Levilactobacillus parabrevis]|uniref:glycoside hydrolase family 32 protein n=1 Tax=Levilactobacillus parabrevis TaxID=357278 RepID=UPI003756A049
MDSQKVNITELTREISEKGQQVAKAPSRLNYHFMPQIGWMNDPNGFIKYKGEYHLFYQFYPHGTSWGPMHWGHAKSKDLLHWEYLPVALAPSEAHDCDPNIEGYGCFSGSATTQNDDLVLMYTGDVDSKEIPQTQNIAISSDGINFDKVDLNPVIPNFPKEATKDFRDPKLFKVADTWYSVIGTHNDTLGELALYSSQDLLKWNYLGILAQSNGKQGTMWECPNIILSSQNDFLIVSPMEGTVNQKPIYISGKANLEEPSFKQNGQGILDYGNDFYAPQTMDVDGRHILIAWMNQWFSKMPTADDGWSGAMTIPRDITIKNGRLYQTPIKELETIRIDQLSEIRNQEVSHLEQDIPEASELKFNLQIPADYAGKIELEIADRKNANQSCTLTVDLKKSEIILDCSNYSVEKREICKAPYEGTGDTIDFDIFLDTNSIEAFINNGETTITNRIYPEAKLKTMKLVCDNQKTFVVNAFSAWKLDKTI